MFKSLASSLLTLAAVLLFAFTMLFVFAGSGGVRFQRVARVDDEKTNEVIQSFITSKRTTAEAVDNSPVTKDSKTSIFLQGMTGGASNNVIGERVVLWISIPGLRTDYIEKSDAPFLKMMVSDGASTMKMKPNFPCVTSSAHATLATGTTVDKHGIAMDRFRMEDGKIATADGPHLLVEPIWATATRQGLRVLVHDWPLSYTQTDNATAISNSSFDPKLTDAQRLDALFKKWSEDQNNNKLRLLMCRLNDIHKGGLTHGPRAAETRAVVGETDKALQKFIHDVKTSWPVLAKPTAELVVLVTTDHGMVALDKMVNLKKLLGPKMVKNIDFVAHDSIAQLYFKDLPEKAGERKLFEKNFDDSMSKRLYFRTFRPDTIPTAWKYTTVGRTGDRVLVLKSGYSFSDFEAEEPVFDPAEGPALFSGFGYPIEDAFRMTGHCVMWGFPNPPGTGDLGEIDQTGFHSTVCKLLGIEPSPAAAPSSIPVN